MNVSDNTVRSRIRDLEERGVITGYQATVDYDSGGVRHHYLFVCSARVSERELLAGRDEITDFAYDVDELGLQIDCGHFARAHVRQPYEAFRLEESV